MCTLKFANIRNVPSERAKKSINTSSIVQWNKYVIYINKMYFMIIFWNTLRCPTLVKQIHLAVVLFQSTSILLVLQVRGLPHLLSFIIIIIFPLFLIFIFLYYYIYPELTFEVIIGKDYYRGLWISLIVLRSL